MQNFGVASPQKLIVGLGNPEIKYAQSRHNTGWMILDYLIEKGNFNIGEKIQSKNCQLWIGKKVLFLKPVIHMNNSGIAVREAARYYKIKNEDIWVINDDIDLKLGTIRIRKGSSSAGHRGVQSVIRELGTQDFCRFRVGVDNREKIKGSFDTDRYVMADFTEKEMDQIKQIAEKIAKMIKEFLSDKIYETSFFGKFKIQKSK